MHIPKKRRAESCVTAVIRDAHGRILLTLRERDPMAGTWHLPGGGVEFGEGHLAAVAREIREELGVEIIIDDRRPLAVTSTLYAAADRHVVALYFSATIASGTPVCGDGTADLVWADEALLRRLNADGTLLDSCRRALNDAFALALPARE